MEYVLGKATRGGVEILQLKSIGEEHTRLEGEFSVTSLVGDAEMTYTGKVKEHYDSQEGVDGTCIDFYELYYGTTLSDLFAGRSEELSTQIEELIVIIGGTPVNELGKWFDKIKKLYDTGKIANLKAFVSNGMITAAEYEEICGQPYEY